MSITSTQIQISKKTRERLRRLSYKSETYDTLVNRIINFEQKFDQERDLHEWITVNYQIFGFDEIVESNLVGKFPDLIIKKNGETLRIEIETFASNFIQHGHDPNMVDMVICILKDVELPVKTLEIENFYKIIANLTTIQINSTTREQLKSKGKKGESYDTIILHLLKEGKT